MAMVMAEAAGHVQTARERTMLLISEDAGGLALDPHAAHASRRAASQWVSRYATHLVIVLVVAALVAVSGLKTFTVQNPYPHGLAAVDSYTGTDQDGQAVTKDGKPARDAQGFELVLPRTQLVTPNDPASVANPGAPGPAGQNAAQGASDGAGPTVALV